MPRMRNYGDDQDHDQQQHPLKGIFSSQNTIPVPLDKDGKPCRTCTDFKTWMKLTGKTANNNSKDHSLSEDELESAVRQSKQCPVDKDELGRAGWTILHTLAGTLPEKESLNGETKTDLVNFVHLWSKLYPCEPCAEDLRKDLKENPVKANTGWEFSQWLCQAHNRVNLKLGKEQFDCSKVYERWRDGWKNGDCD